MRGKRSKQYRKLMQQYGLTFGFREPYQVLVDAGMLEAAVVQFKMDLMNGLTRTLHGEVKPMLTQCTIRHLYNLRTIDSRNPAQQQNQPPASQSPSKFNSQNEPSAATPTLTNADKTAIITLARTFEKRRCDHAELEEPLSTHACLSSVIDSKSTQTNKHRYVLAVQDEETRSWARSVRGVPSIYVRRSVMIMEPMADVSVNVKEGAEREKLRGGVKRKRGEAKDEVAQVGGEDADVAKRKEKKPKGAKGVNPLSVKKPKKRVEAETARPNQDQDHGGDGGPKKRRRKHKGATGTADSTIITAVAAASNEE